MNQQRPSILIVDDEPANIDMLAAVLQQRYEIYVALSGEQCLQRAASGVPLKLILLDVVMPSMDGFQVCRELKRNPATRDIPVIFITARDSEEDETEGLGAGAVDFIAKPFRPAILAARVRTHVLLQEQKTRLKDSESLLKATLQSTKDGILVMDDQGRIALHNQRLAELWRIPAEGLSGGEQALPGYMKEQMEQPELFAANLRRLHNDGDTNARTLRFKDGRVVTQFSLPLRQDGAVSGRVWSFSDVTEEKRLEAELRRLTITDVLTGLFNRRHMMAVLAREWERRARYGYELGLLLCDLDHFKHVNDEHGHDVGDRVLRAAADLMAKQFRNIDTCCRYGGEEFCAIMPNSTLDGAAEAAERFRRAVGEMVVEGLHLTVSIGIASSGSPKDGDMPEGLLKWADEALYRAKAEGRNRVCATSLEPRSRGSAEIR